MLLQLAYDLLCMKSLTNSVYNSVWYYARVSVWKSVNISVWGSAWFSVRDSVWGSVDGSVSTFADPIRFFMYEKFI